MFDTDSWVSLDYYICVKSNSVNSFLFWLTPLMWWLILSPLFEHSSRYLALFILSLYNLGVCAILRLFLFLVEYQALRTCDVLTSYSLAIIWLGSHIVVRCVVTRWGWNFKKWYDTERLQQHINLLVVTAYQIFF